MKKSEKPLTVQDFPAYVEAKQKLDALRQQQRELEAAWVEADRTGGSTSPGADVSHDAESLLSGGVATAPSKTELHHSRKVLDEAVARQQCIVQSEQRAAGAQIVESRRPEEAAIAKGLVEVFDKLDALVQADTEFRLSLSQSGAIGMAAGRPTAWSAEARGIALRVQGRRIREKIRAAGF